MTESHESALDSPAPEKSRRIESPPEITPVKPQRELTARAIGVAVVVAALMGAAEPVVVLKIGYGPNLSVVSAFLGFIAISLFGLVSGTRGTRWENNLVQTAGTAAGSGVGFMAVVVFTTMGETRWWLNASWQVKLPAVIGLALLGAAAYGACLALFGFRLRDFSRRGAG